jgi:hypothetical protein
VYIGKAKVLYFPLLSVFSENNVTWYGFYVILAMHIHVHIHHHGPSKGNEEVMELLIDNNKKLVKMANELETLQAEVSETKTVMGSAVTLLQGLKAKLDEAIGNPAALAALSAELDTNTNALAAAITANTPSEGEPTP